MSLIEEYNTILSSFTSSSSTLSQAITSLSGLLTKIETGVKENERKAQELATKEETIKKRVEEVSAREAAVTKREQAAKALEDSITEREKKYAAVIKETEANKEKMINRVKLNVGGQVFTTSKATLLRCEGCFFDKMVSTGKFHLEDGEYFVDRDPRFFDIILNYMRDSSFHVSHLQPRELEILQSDWKFYGIDPYAPSPFPFPSFVPYIKTWLPNRRFKLLFTADSTQTDIETEFHKHCDKQGKTLIVMESTEGYIFGGYSSMEWDLPTNSRFASKTSLGKDSFIFTLSNPHSIPPTKYTLQAQANASICNAGSAFVVVFSFGQTLDGDINVRQEVAGSRLSTESNFPQCYVDTTGRGKETFTGKDRSDLKQLLVYQVIE